MRIKKEKRRKPVEANEDTYTLPAPASPAGADSSTLNTTQSDSKNTDKDSQADTLR